jgi:hypothetical protein
VQVLRQNDVGNRLSPYRNYLLSQYAALQHVHPDLILAVPVFIKAAVLT